MPSSGRCWPAPPGGGAGWGALLAAARRDVSTVAQAADPVAAATAAADGVRAAAEQDGIALRVVAPDEGWRVGADEDVVAQALQPLLDNAVRHAREAVT